MELDYGSCVPACWRPKRGGGVVRELRRGDVVRVVYLSRTGNNWSGGSAVGRTAVEKNFDGERRQGDLVEDWCRVRFGKHQ
jgi:hypothetical protein